MPSSEDAELGPWVEICRADVADGGGRTVICGQFVLAIFNDGGRFHVLDNSCTHAGGSLGGGRIVAGAVVCPWHHFSFDLATGRNREEALASVKVYPCKIEGGKVFARLRT